MLTRLKVFAAAGVPTITAALLLLPQAIAATAGAQTPSPLAAPASAMALPASPPPSSAGIFPLSAVQAGQHGVAYTVFTGSRPEPMGVEILGVLHNALGPGQDMILARLSGEKPEYTGVVAGMSGSPVYIDGKLAGALAFRIGQFSKEPIAGITPIERMLEVRDLPRTPAEPNQAATVPYGSSASRTEADKAAALVHPIDTPLVFNGFSPAALDLWRTHSPFTGLQPVAGLGGSTVPADAQPTPDSSTSDPLVPGSAVSALLVEGDLEIAATCTVTYVDPTRLLACGHPITQFGAVSMPMTRASVVATLPSPLNAFKIVNTGAQVGSFTEDRETAIGGILGEPARMIPVTVHLAEAGKPTHTLRLRVVDQPQLTPTAVLVSVFQGLSQANAYAAEDSYRMRGEIHVAGYPPVELHGLAGPSDAGPASLAAALEIGARFSRLYDSGSRQTPLQSVELNIERLPERLTAQLERCEADRTTVHAGESLTVFATLRPWHAAVHTVPVTITLPPSLPQGTVRLLLSDGPTLDRLTATTRGKELDLAGTIAQINALHAEDRLYVTLLPGDAQAVVEGRVLPELPASMANIYEPQRSDGKAALNGESLLELTSAPVSTQLSGQQVIVLRVE